MGKGIDAARDQSPLHAQVLDDLKDQLLIAFVRRLGNQVSIPISEVDETGKFCLTFGIKDDNLNFQLIEKQ